MPKQRPHRSRQDYETPSAFIWQVEQELLDGSFVLDVCADETNHKAAEWFNEGQNGLTAPWSKTGWNWCNPPFGQIKAWVRKASYGALFPPPAGYKTAVLVPASPGTNWWKNCIHNQGLVLFLQPRLTFVGEQHPYPKDMALVLFGPSPLYRGGYHYWRWKP